MSHYQGRDYDDFVVDLRTHFSGQHPLRSQLPKFQKNRIVLGSLPEPVLGGLFPAFSRDLLENYLLKPHTFQTKVSTPSADAVPGLSSPRSAAEGFSLTLRGVRDRAYSLQFNTNLINSAGWQDAAAGFFAEDNTIRLGDAGAPGSAARFYRVVERGNMLPPPLNDNFANRITLTGFPAIGRGYTAGATTEIGEPAISFGSGHTVWWRWIAPSNSTVILFTGDARVRVQCYTGSVLGALSEVSLTGWHRLHDPSG